MTLKQLIDSITDPTFLDLVSAQEGLGAFTAEQLQRVDVDAA